MEFTYPINFIGYDDGETNGEVFTRHGEFLGMWTFNKDEEKQTGAFIFIPDGEVEPLFSESVGILDSGYLKGLALSTITKSIRDWYEERNQT